MATNKRSKGNLVYWVMVTAAFIVVIVVLLATHMHNSRKAAVTQVQNNLNSQVGEWITVLNDMVDDAILSTGIYKELEADGTIEWGSHSAFDYFSYLASQSKFSHVYMCNKDICIFDEEAMYPSDTEVPFDYRKLMFMGYLKEGLYIIDTDGKTDGTAFAYCIPVGGETEFRYVLFTILFDDLSNLFSASYYKDSSFLAYVNKKGEVTGVFDSYSDHDSGFITGGNVLKPAESGLGVAEYTVFKNRIAMGNSVSTVIGYNGDTRFLICTYEPAGDGFFVLGVRDYYARKLVDTLYSETKSASVRLIIVIFMFALLILGILIATSVKHKERGRELEDKADTDLLTDLNNKLATERKIQEYIEEHPDGRALMFILDIDNFKKINDTMGHAFGDIMLKTFGKEIRSEFRVGDIIGRVGGDEFIIFLKDMMDDVKLEHEAQRLTEFFHDFKAGGDYVKYSATASIGAAIFPDDASSFQSLYEAADQALYRAKERGKNRLVFYDEEAHHL